MKTRKIISHPVSITSAAVILFVAAVLIATPYLIGSFMQSWIESQGQLTEQVDDIDFNPFTGTLVLHNLQVETASGRSLEIPFASARLSWPHLMNKQVYLKDWTIQDAYLVVDTLEGKRLRVAGLILEEIIGATDETSTSEWAVGIGRFQILNSRVIYNTPELEATYHIDRYQLTGLESWDKENAVVFELKGKINTSPVHIKAEVTPFAPAPVWKGNVKLQKGDLSLLSKVWGLQDLNMDGGINGDLDLEAVLQEDNIIDINAKGSVNINQLKIRNADIALSEEHIAWEGTVSAKKLPSQGVDIMAEGRLTSGSLDVNILSRGSHLQLAGYTWQGKTQFRQQGDSSVLSMEAELEGGNTSITDTLRNLKLLQFNKINIQNIAAQSLEDIHISTITLQKTLILAHGQNEATDSKDTGRPLVHVEKADIKDISLKGSKDLFISSVTLKDFQAYLRRNKQGQWRLLETYLKPSVNNPQGSAQATQPSDSPLTFNMNLMQVSGKSSIHFEDESPYRPYRTTLQIKEFQLSNINTADAGSPARIKLDTRVGDYSSVSLNGDVKPFEELLSIDMKGQIHALAMPPLSSYTGPTIGYNLTSGQMDADLNIKATRGELDSNADIRMRNLEVAKEDPDKVPEIDNQMDVPLEQALAFLEDDNDEIGLNIEIKGNINNPEFDIQDVINQALGKAMKYAAVQYLKYTLQPFGTYIALAEVAVKAGKEIARVRLDPVQFAPGSSDLNETAEQYLKRVAEILANRPSLRMEICGKASEKDRISLKKPLQGKDREAEEKETVAPSEQDLLGLAKTRAEVIKSLLVSQYKISHERMYLCLPEILEAPEQQPAAELLIE